MSDKDKSKAEKIAAARKKLKEFQTKPKLKPSQKSEKQNNAIDEENINTETTQQCNLHEKQENLVKEIVDTPIKDTSIEATEKRPEFQFCTTFEKSTNNEEFLPIFNAHTESSTKIIDTINKEDITLKSPLSNDTVNYHNLANDDNKNILQNISCESLDQLSKNMAIFIQSESLAPLKSSPSNDDKILENLSSSVNAEMIKNEELSAIIREQNSQIERLKIDIQNIKVENANKNAFEMGTLQKQLQSHIQTVGILVGEKAELTATLSKYQSISKDKTVESEELQSRLNASRHRVMELEKEINVLKKSQENYDQLRQNLCFDFEKTQEEVKSLRKLNDVSTENLNELKQKINLQNNDYKKLQTDYDKKVSELNLSHLRIEQLSFGETGTYDNKIETLAQQNLAYEQQVNELQQTLKQLTNERDQSNVQYQKYVQQLNTDVATFAQRITELEAENERVIKCESNYVKHISELEKQIQQQIVKQNNNEQQSKPQQSKDYTIHLEAQLKEITLLNDENLNLKQQLNEKSNLFNVNQQQITSYIDEIENLKLTIERLSCEQPDANKLLATIESDKVAASRALLQNQELKQQIIEMQNAFVQLSNDKLQLTDKLQTEQYLCKEYKIKYDEMATNLTNVTEKLHFKDEEMIRLAHENTDLSRKILENNQELDRLRHYEVSSHVSDVLQNELKNANEQITILKKRIKNHDNGNTVTAVVVDDDSNKIDIPRSESVENIEIDLDSKINELYKTIEELNEEKINFLKQIDELKKSLNHHTHNYDHDHCDHSHDHDENHTNSFESHSAQHHSVPKIPTTQAMEKLQERFTRTMSEIADLNDEKQRLEHLVMQLQGETETVGEYIALYHTQRKLLKQREIEKDIQLQMLSADREEMKNKLMQLNKLVEQLLMQKNENLPKNNEVNIDQQANGHVEESKALIDNSNTVSQTIGDSKDTAVKILELLTDIKESNMNYSHLVKPMSGIHHCACCSGKLEVV